MALPGRRLPEAGERGFTIIEVVIAFSLLAVVMWPVSSLLDSAVRSTGDLRNRVVAGNLAAEQLELARASGFTALSTIANSAHPTTTFTRTAGTVTYTVAQSLRWLNESGSGCGGSGGNGTLAATLLVQEVITWPGMGATAPVEADTKVAPPVSAYSTQGAALAVSLTDSGSPAQPDPAGIPVTFSPGTGNSSSAFTVNTDSSGCAYAPNLAAGNWNVSATQTGYVDPNENATVASPANVTAGSTLALGLRYAPGGTFTVAWPTGVAAPPSGMQVSVSSSQLTAGSFAFTPTAAMSSPNLWAYPAPGYTVYSGSCPDSSPTYSNHGAYAYPTLAASPTQVTLSQGSALATPVTVGLWELDLVATSTKGPVSGLQVVLGDSTCTAGTGIYTVTSPSGTLSVGLPLGTWTLLATGTAGGNAVSGTTTVTISGTSPTPAAVTLK